jgi:cold shock CspA family protein
MRQIGKRFSVMKRGSDEGTVKWSNNQKGSVSFSAFLEKTPSSTINAIQESEFKSLNEGQAVESYSEEGTERTAGSERGEDLTRRWSVGGSGEHPISGL